MGWGEHGAQEKAKTVPRGAGGEGIGAGTGGRASGGEGGSSQEEESGETQSYAGKAAGRDGVIKPAALVESCSDGGIKVQHDRTGITHKGTAVGPGYLRRTRSWSSGKANRAIEWKVSGASSRTLNGLRGVGHATRSHYVNGQSRLVAGCGARTPSRQTCRTRNLVWAVVITGVKITGATDTYCSHQTGVGNRNQVLGIDGPSHDVGDVFRLRRMVISAHGLEDDARTD